MRAKLAVLSVALVLLQFGLAVWGLGSLDRFLSQPPLIALCVVAATFLIISFFSSGNLSSGEREDRSNRWIFMAIAVLGLLLAFVPAYTDRIGFWTIDGETTRWIGVGLVILGGALRIWPVFVLGNRFSGLVAIQPGHRLVTTGPYSMIRNPSYLGLIVGAVGWALAFRSLVGVILALLHLVPLIARMDSEEALLRSHFGAEYEAYYQRTWRLLPWLY
ncbi:isoprenylcysteine carboxylmethyltransferase family protein [uncultured Methylovirgula sp.]|uniref:methyltransferase family protein n=1 Tax=uncultured Methylovirgula sp. TaxID=1285960 RepID=UPI002637450B|nr:isoprenylcysteine carboxylmethyltransferase family protein [uncultured Methylovirgula sp.]